MRQKVFIIMTALSALLLQTNDAAAGHIRKRKIKKQFKHSAILNDHFTGFALYDLDDKKMIWQQNADKYFTPASNTKLFTFYTCLKMLGDSIPALKYITRHDSLIFWGAGDPSFLHSGLKGIKAINFLKSSNKKLFFATGNYNGNFYGDGWAWNDYNDYYQPEITELPLEDNVAEFYADKNDSIQVRPAYFKRFLKCDSNYHPSNFSVQRDFISNKFVYPAAKPPKDFVQDIPWKTSIALTLTLLQDTLKLPVGEIRLPLPDSAKTIYGANADTVYRHMLQPSDNFIAEQLLLVCSSAKFKILSSDSVRSYAKVHFLNDLPDVPQWADGSGLSRQNLFTPRSITALLVKIDNEVKNDSLLHSLLPEGGVVGTIRHAYKTDNGQPFIWAKTGSLNNVYNQGGYFVTRKGKRLAFSFMNNNFIRPASEVRAEMARIVTWIHDEY
ncbi:D-alanyl-D-alanine carboxypeptidase [Mucilaginibacter sp.]|uniref:D-alanyl-D-alanine carboxypeptidase/D-alanyl-D-alanine-endopeptidase n=1 Tax=Mucilaginibacter sp. TaxID=1882438 RepID=UPI00283B15B3|nr:D-alanyl-D-alanine carboxypeptidase [Mucilaginibacter sp.]MDR3695712.1 D-alanyl-D-alanine carboxypeptidase [Mucilaginibacter sp.]